MQIKATWLAYEFNETAPFVQSVCSENDLYLINAYIECCGPQDAVRQIRTYYSDIRIKTLDDGCINGSLI